MRAPPPFAALRRHRGRLAMLALVALLAAQLAIAAYACPLLERRGEPPLPCHEIDVDAPALCKAFLQSDEQNLDSPRFDPGAAPPAAFGIALPDPARGAQRAAPYAAPPPLPPPLIVLLGRRRD